MKKLFLFIVFALSLSVSHANDTTSVVSNITGTVSKTLASVDTSSLSKTIYKDFKSGIDAIASSLKVGATHVYEVLVKQQYVYSIIYLIVYLVLLAFTISLYKITRKTYKAHRILCGYADSDRGAPDLDNSPKGVLSVVLAIITIGIFIALIATFGTTIETVITGFVNPEYGAMKDIVNFTK